MIQDTKSYYAKSYDIISDIAGTQFTVETPTGKKTFDLTNIFAVDQNSLSEELSKQAAVYAYFCVLAARAEKQAMIADMEKDQEYAVADEDYRKQSASGGTKITEAQIRSMIMNDEDYIAKVRSHLNAVYNHNLLKSIVRAMEQRAMMLQSLGSHLRHEFSMTGMTVQDMEMDKLVSDARKVLSSKKKEQV